MPQKDAPELVPEDIEAYLDVLLSNAQKAHFILLTVSPTQNTYQAISREGEIFDELTE